jgi:hypothetical protein
MLVPVAAQSKAWVCGRSLPEIASSNPAGDVDIRRLRMLCVVKKRSIRRANHSSRGILPTVVCLSVICKHRELVGPGTKGVGVSH